ncbi:16S rRNA (guanine(527)-N(7))-methyltransferase RsmG [Rhodospirillales bacterium]|jgi:16S rRNA (guanine527-N7)-methyltransferase|nr:16S rRNA (guanine(527)-N(7))-methyltransferase RsmG [Rhodospirillales bacterium]
MTDATPLTKEGCAEYLSGIDADTMDRFEIYLALLSKWQRAINLVGKNTLANAWRRHILDSAQLLPHIEKDLKIADLGSGAGLPGLVIAIATGANVQLVESDQRKATFMREVARETGTDVDVHVARIEDLPSLDADIVTARALAPLPKLLPWVHRHLKKGGKSVLMKGAGVDQELTESTKQWTMNVVRKFSISDASGTILIVNDLLPLTDS